MMETVYLDKTVRVVREGAPAVINRQPAGSEIQKIAVLRANKLADFIYALPALQTLREAYPEAEIVLLGRAWHADFLKNRPSPIDRVVVIPPVRGIYSPVELPAVPGSSDEDDDFGAETFFEMMAEEHFDLAIQVHGDGRFSNPFVQRLGARLTVGTKDQDAAPLDLWVPYTTTQSEILRHLEVVSLVGAKTAVVEPRLQVTNDDVEQALELMPGGHRPLVALHPGGQDPRQRWPAEKFAAIGDALAVAGAQIAILGDEADRDIASTVQSLMRSDAVDLCGNLQPRTLIGFLSRCKLMIANNSDFLHLAWGINLPTVGIFWYGNLLNTGPLNRARHRPAISWRSSCPICGKDVVRFPCDHTGSYLADVPIVEVLASALDLLAKSHKSDIPALPG